MIAIAVRTSGRANGVTNASIAAAASSVAATPTIRKVASLPAAAIATRRVTFPD